MDIKTRREVINDLNDILELLKSENFHQKTIATKVNTLCIKIVNFVNSISNETDNRLKIF